jgi:hypothetical protein
MRCVAITASHHPPMHFIADSGTLKIGVRARFFTTFLLREIILL